MLPAKINIFIVDDHYLILQGLKTLLIDETGFQVTGVTNNPTEVMAHLEKHPTDILLTDVSMPLLSGSQLTTMVLKKFPNIRVIALSMFNEPHIVKEMMKAGVCGYILKDASKNELIAALNAVAAGKKYFSPTIQEIFSITDSEELFTAREVEILKLIIQEFNNKQIGEKLYISERTVETHRRNILKKSNVSNTIGLVKYAYDHKIV
jgi:DNA-binding NarL/FixJ family response regulator